MRGHKIGRTVSHVTFLQALSESVQGGHYQTGCNVAAMSDVRSYFHTVLTLGSFGHGIPLANFAHAHCATLHGNSQEGLNKPPSGLPHVPNSCYDIT